MSTEAEQQAAFVGILATPLVTPWSDPTLHRLVHRHAHKLSTWAARLNYRLVSVNRCYRLRRPAIDGAVALPPGSPPPRGHLVLALYAAICLERFRDDSVTLQDLSDRVYQFAALQERWQYDPNRRSQRKMLVGAVDLLQRHGVLERRTRASLTDDWERQGEGIGGGFILHREALMLLIDTADLELALARRSTDTDQRSASILRRIVETQALYPDELSDSERAYLTGQRSRLIRLAEEMTGGTVEPRTDAWVLILPAGRELPADARLAFPDATAVDWVCLALLDALSVDASGFHRVESSAVDAAARHIHGSKAELLTIELRDSKEAIRAAAEGRLVDLGLLRVADGDWLLTPAAGRYRNADLDGQPSSTPEALFQE